MPTFSGVLGMLCASLGISFRKQPNAVKELRDALQMDVHVVTQGSRLIDFQGAGGGENSGTPYGKMCIPKDDAGSTGKIYEKEYLQGAYFEVVLRLTDSSVSDKLVHSLQNPKWQMFAGRKGCLLSLPPFGGAFDTPEEVKNAWVQEGVKPVMHYIQNPLGESIKDYPVCLGDNQTVFRKVVKESSWP